MTDSLSVRSVIEAMSERLVLRWIAGQGGDERLITHEPGPKGSPSLVGHLNLIHPNQIQVLGRDELSYVQGLRKNSLRDVLERLVSGHAAMLIVTDGLGPTPELQAFAEEASVPCCAPRYRTTS
jgi:HPr kinase/phosphorylase